MKRKIIVNRLWRNNELFDDDSLVCLFLLGRNLKHIFKMVDCTRQQQQQQQEQVLVLRRGKQFPNLSELFISKVDGNN